MYVFIYNYILEKYLLYFILLTQHQITEELLFFYLLQQDNVRHNRQNEQKMYIY